MTFRDSVYRLKFKEKCETLLMIKEELNKERKSTVVLHAASGTAKKKKP